MSPVSVPPKDIRSLLARTPPAIYAEPSEFWDFNQPKAPQVRQDSSFWDRELLFFTLDHNAKSARTFQVGWDGYDAPQPNDASIEATLTVLRELKLKHRTLTPYSVLPSADGGMGISFRGRNGRRAVLELLNGGSASFWIYGGGEANQSDEFIPTDAELQRVLGLFSENL